MLTFAVKMVCAGCVVVFVVVKVQIIFDVDPANAWQARFVKKSMNWLDRCVESFETMVVERFDECRPDEATVGGDFEDRIESVVLEALKDPLLDDTRITPPTLVRFAKRRGGVLDVVEVVERCACVKQQFVVDHGNVSARAVSHTPEKVNLYTMKRERRRTFVLHEGGVDEDAHDES